MGLCSFADNTLALKSARRGDNLAFYAHGYCAIMDGGCVLMWEDLLTKAGVHCSILSCCPEAKENVPP